MALPFASHQRSNVIHIDINKSKDIAEIKTDAFNEIIITALKVLIEERGGEFTLTRSDFIRLSEVDVALQFGPEADDQLSEHIKLVTFVSGVKQ